MHNLKTLRLTDLPLATGWLEHQFFSNCHLTGPAVLALGDQIVLQSNTFATPDQFFPVDADRNHHGMIGVRYSVFLDCVFDETVGFAIVRDNWEATMDLLLDAH